MRKKGIFCIFMGLAATLLLVGSAAAQGGALVRAEWGVRGARVDVTSRVRTFVHDGVLQLEVTRFNLGIDPAPHQVKDLVIQVRRWNGEVEEFKYPERSNVSLELDPEDRGEAAKLAALIDVWLGRKITSAMMLMHELLVGRPS